MGENKKDFSPSEGIGKSNAKFVTEEDVFAILQTLLLDSAQIMRIKSGYIQSRNYQDGYTGWKLDANGGLEAQVVSLVNLAALPPGPSNPGDMCCVLQKLRICTAAGTPGTWAIVGTQS